MEFTKKPVSVEAVRWTGKNTKEVRKWIEAQCAVHAPENPLIREGKIALFVKRRATGMSETLWQNIAQDDWSDDITAAVYDYLHLTYVGVKDGQWIICGTEGEFYPCADDGTGTAPLNYAASENNVDAIMKELSHYGGDEPDEPGWYAYSGGRQKVIFHLGVDGQWSAHFDNGSAADCAWGYIEQTLGVWDLVPLVPERGTR